MDLPAIIREARERARLSRPEVERRLGLEPRTLERWELRGQRPSDADLARLASLLGLSEVDVGLPSLREEVESLVLRHGHAAVSRELARIRQGPKISP